MKYCNIKGANGLYYRNMILLENIADYNEYIKESFDVDIEDSQKEIITKIKNHGLGHCTHNIAEVAETISNITGQGSLYIIGDLSNKIKSAQLELILKGYKIVINERGGYFYLSENDTIEPHIIYVEKDIHINRWKGGKHYYAKIGHIEVEDESGNIKWNTPEYAKKTAIEYMNKLNQNV